MGWLLLALLVAVMVGMAMVSWQRLSVTFWVRGEALTWVMGFRVAWIWWQFGDSWLIPKTPAAHASAGMSFDPSLVHDGLWVLSWYRHFIHRAWHCVRVTQFQCEGTIGLGEAADTGMAVGAMSSLIGWWLAYHILPQTRQARPSMGVQPNWDQPDFRFHLLTRFWFRPWSLMVAAFQSFGVQILGGWRLHTLRRVQHGHVSGGTHG